MAMRLDGKIELVAGAFSLDPQKSKLSGEDLLLDPKRVYPDYRTMATEEGRLPAGERIDFVSVVTPNRTHVPVAKAFLEAGFNVVCDKPLAFNLDEARALRDVVRKTGKVFAQVFALRQPGKAIAGFPAWEVGPQGDPIWVESMDFLTGAPGVGLALLAAVSPVEPTWDRILLVSGPPGRSYTRSG